MIDALIFISQRPIVITLALIGAALVIAGSLTARAGETRNRTATSSRHQSLLSRSLTSSGYVVTFASILLFIVAGFVSDLRP